MRPVIAVQLPTNDKPQDEAARNRSKSNIVRKVNEIKEAFRLKNQDERREVPSSTILPTFQTDLPSIPRDYIKYFIPVIAELNPAGVQPIGTGDYLFARYRVEAMILEGAIFTLYEVLIVVTYGSVVDSNEKVQIKVFHPNQHHLALAELTSYMHVYESKLIQEGWLTQLKDFFFLKVTFNFRLRANLSSCSSILELVSTG